VVASSRNLSIPNDCPAHIINMIHQNCTIPTLLSLAAKKATDELAYNSGLFAARLAEFEPEQQPFLLQQIGNCIAKLKKKSNDFEKTMPATDRRIHEKLSPAIAQNDEEDECEDEMDERECFLAGWEWIDDETSKELQFVDLMRPF
jgi:hypothetical protein